MKETNFKEAKQCFKDAYDYFLTRYGETNEEVITILNNLSVACANVSNYILVYTFKCIIVINWYIIIDEQLQ